MGIDAGRSNCSIFFGCCTFLKRIFRLKLEALSPPSF
jgi:hypothetical protein